MVKVYQTTIPATVLRDARGKMTLMFLSTLEKETDVRAAEVSKGQYFDSGSSDHPKGGRVKGCGCSEREEQRPGFGPLSGIA